MTNPSLRFLGAAGNVTGSCTLVEWRGKRLLVDCGLHQERDLRGRDWEPFPVPPSSIDAVLLTHAHLDHCGLLPRLAREGFRGPVHCTAATADITRIVLLDSARIQEEDAEFKQRRHEQEGRPALPGNQPLYTEADAEAAAGQLAVLDYGQILELGAGLTASFHQAGHILGSAMIRLEFSGNGRQRRVVFSGDIGRWDKPIIEDPTLFGEAEPATDAVVMESTYGDRLHEDPKSIDALLADSVNSTRRAGGNLLIPSFALERTQELLYYLSALLRADRIPHLMVFVDSPMAVSVTEVFKRHAELFDADMRDRLRRGDSPFDFPGLKMVRTVEESKSINHLRGTAIIIAGSGMCTGGRIKHHLVHNIQRRESTLLFIGYQAAGTLGREILEGAKEVRILGKNFRCRARVLRISGFSAHADQSELLRWLAGFEEPPRQILLNHGEHEALAALAAAVQERTGRKPLIPHYDQRVEIL
jgi:metallo-beta-lactamase family protein